MTRDEKLAERIEIIKNRLSTLTSNEDEMSFAQKDLIYLLTQLETEIEKSKKLRDAAALGLSFAPKGPVPEGLDPTFYHTLNYTDEVSLQKRIDDAREALAAYDKGET